MKIYVAASFTKQKTEAAEVAATLRAVGHVITSRWLEVEPEYDTSDMSRHALMDEADVRVADVIVCLTGDTASRGGRHTEVGIAIALNKRVILIGPREQVFHWHPLVEVVQALGQLTLSLRLTEKEAAHGIG